MGLLRTAVLALLWLAPAFGLAAAPTSIEDKLRAALTDPDQPGEPPTIRKLVVNETRALIGLELAHGVPLDDLPPDVENRYEVAVGLLAALRPQVQAIDLVVAHPGEPLAAPKPLRPFVSGRRAPLHTVRADPMRFPDGQALLGKTIAISPGHGYIYYDSLGRYSTQRGNIKWEGCGSCDGIIEDFGSHQLAVRYLIPLLEGAGARVVLMRERDETSQGAIVDDGDAAFSQKSGSFSMGSSAGGQAGDYLVSSDNDASAQWTLSAPQPGLQMLSLWFVSGSNRHANAWVEVNGGAGSTRFLLDMTSHGRRWVPVGLMQLGAGTEVQVSLSAPTNPQADSFLIADAVRLGSGTHSSGHPWWSMGAQPFAGYQDAPASIQGYSDVSIRPVYAEFYGADAYLSLHSNASGQPSSTAAGTSSYRYNCGSFPDHSSDPPASSCDDPTGSDQLQADVHAAMVGQIKADWDPNWRDRGTKVANFGEVRNLDGIPGVLMESAFHDNVRLPAGSDLRMTDNQAMHDPRWRRAAAIGLYKGVSKYFAPSAPFVLEAPTALAVRRLNASSIEVSFSQVPGATGYRIYAAADEGPYDAGRLVTSSPAVIEDLPEGAVISVRIASVNPAGEGAKGGIVCARTSKRPAQALIVDGFDREDAWVQEWDNRKNTAWVHGLALSGTDYAFDGANEAALAANLINTESYDALIVALGRESTEHDILTPALRTEVKNNAAAGQAVFFAGTEIGGVLGARGDATTQAFLDDVFGAVYSADDAGSGRVKGAGGWLDAGLDAALGDDAQGLVQTHFPDAFTLGTDGVAELTYDNGSDLAGVRRGKNLLLGVALDNIVGAAARAQVLGGWLSEAVELAPEDIAPPVDAGTPDPDAGIEVDAGEIMPMDAGVQPPLRDGGVPIVRLLPRSAVPVTGGCTCSDRPTGAAWWVLLAVLPVLGRRRLRV